jgi:hypothetical protein
MKEKIVKYLKLATLALQAAACIQLLFGGFSFYMARVYQTCTLPVNLPVQCWLMMMKGPQFLSPLLRHTTLWITILLAWLIIGTAGRKLDEHHIDLTQAGISIFLGIILFLFLSSIPPTFPYYPTIH